MTLGQLRQLLFTIWLVATGAAFWQGAVPESGDFRYFGLTLVSMLLLFIPTVRIGRLQGSTPLEGLGLAVPSVVYLLLGMGAPVLLTVHSMPAAAAWIGLVVTYVWFERAARAALTEQAETLRAARGDADVGVFTALTPMAGPPTARPEPTSHPTHTQYDPAAVRDLLDAVRPKRATDD